MRETKGPSRRAFLAGAAAAGVILSPGVVLYARDTDEPASSATRWGMLIDTTRCAADCTACVAACSTEFGLAGHGPATDPQWIRKVTLTAKATGRTVHLPVMCQHCGAAPCIEVCPTGASFKREDGIVLVDRHRCIGCRYCLMACPYKARSFGDEPVSDQRPFAPRGKGTVEACTLCVHRIDAGGLPACAESCAATGHRAILFGDLNDPTSEIAKRVAAVATTQLRGDLATDPGVRYQGL